MGFEEYNIRHKKSSSAKNRIQLVNEDHVVRLGFYVANSLAGYAFACGIGAPVATDILTR
ncbi:hypothetical protein BH23BAC2_BH23BAC2_19160 [soil metagenome]